MRGLAAVVRKSPYALVSAASSVDCHVRISGNLYRRIYPQDVPAETAQAEMRPVLLVGRMSVPAELDAKFNDAYNNERLPLCQRIPGYIRARRFEAVMGEPQVHHGTKWRRSTSGRARPGTTGARPSPRCGTVRFGRIWSMPRGRRACTVASFPRRGTSSPWSLTSVTDDQRR